MLVLFTDCAKKQKECAGGMVSFLAIRGEFAILTDGLSWRQQELSYANWNALHQLLHCITGDDLFGGTKQVAIKSCHYKL